MPIQNNYIPEPFQSILNNACAGVKDNKKPKKPKKSEGASYDRETRGYNEACENYELWLKEVFSVENIKEVMLKTPHKVDSLWTSGEIAKAIHNLTKEQ